MARVATPDVGLCRMTMLKTSRSSMNWSRARHNSRVGILRRFVREGGVVALGVAEGLEERQHDAVCRGPVKGTVAAWARVAPVAPKKLSARAMRADTPRRGDAGAVY
jgi:hypothetical protein